MSPRHYWLWLVPITLVAFGLRLWIWSIQGQPVTVSPGSDQDEYFRGAIHIVLQGDYYDDGQWLRPPLTSLFLALIFAVAGVDLSIALLVQCLLSAITGLLLADLARRLFNSRAAGLAAATLAALFLPYVNYASQLLSETLFIFMSTAALLVLTIAWRKGFPWHWTLASGALWGLATLTRAVGLYALPLLVVWIAWERAATSGGPASLATRLRLVARQAGLSLVACLLGFVIVVGPWTARNWTVYDQLVLVDTNGGVSFWFGTLLEPNERELQFVWNTSLPNSALRQQAALRQAWSNIRRQPLTFLSRTRPKTVSLWQLESRLYAGNANMGNSVDKLSYPFVFLSDVEYLLIMLLALLALVVSRPQERCWAVLGWPLYGTILSAFTLGHPRLRLPLLVALIVYAAFPLAHPRVALARLRQSTAPRWAALAGGLAILALLLYSTALLSFARAQFWLATASLGGGRPAIERAIAAAPDNFLAYRALGDWLRRAGDDTAALQAYDRAAARDANDLPTQVARLALRRRGVGPPDLTGLIPADADNNLTYDWAWSAQPGWSEQRFSADLPAAGVARGLYGSAEDGERRFRWTTGRAQFRFSERAPTTLVLTLRADEEATAVSVYAGGHLLGVVQVGATWQDYTLPVPPGTISADPALQGVIEIVTPVHVASVADPYPRGVAIAAAVLR